MYLVAASDGVWEFLDNNRVKDIVDIHYINNDGIGACEALVKESTKYWERVIN
jgi:hypothetical protein